MFQSVALAALLATSTLAAEDSSAKELSSAATEICFPFVSNPGSHHRLGAVRTLLSELGYASPANDYLAALEERIGSDRMRSFVFGQRVTEDSNLILVASDIGPFLSCQILLTDDSTVPSQSSLQGRFESVGWKRGIPPPAPVGSDPVYAYFYRDGTGDEDIYAMVRVEPKSDPTVRLAIQIRSTSY